MKKLIVCLLTMVVCFNVAFAEKIFRQEFKMNTSSYVSFDSTTTVMLECPDVEGAKWLKAHFAEWFGKDAPKIVEGVTSLSLPEVPADAKADKHVSWPTISHFADKGLSVAGCPWMNYNDMMPMAEHIVNKGGFGFVETTWHRLRAKEWEKMYMSAGYAAWGSPVSHGVTFERSLRIVGSDMKVKSYLDTGHLNYQIPPSYNGD